jgi:hypothetical protein
MPFVFVALLVLVLAGFAVLAPRMLSAAHREPPPPRAAMCYKRAAPSQTVDFVCPKDGSRTLYGIGSPIGERVGHLPQLQAMARALAREAGSRATIVLDLSEFCRTCTPTPPAPPEPVLSVKLPDGKETRTRGITPEDLVLLEEFLVGSSLHKASDGKTSPLEESLPRIREILGMPDAKIEKAAKGKKTSPRHPVLDLRDKGGFDPKF